MPVPSLNFECCRKALSCRTYLLYLAPLCSCCPEFPVGYLLTCKTSGFGLRRLNFNCLRSIQNKDSSTGFARVGNSRLQVCYPRLTYCCKAFQQVFSTECLVDPRTEKSSHRHIPCCRPDSLVPHFTHTWGKSMSSHLQRLQEVSKFPQVDRHLADVETAAAPPCTVVTCQARYALLLHFAELHNTCIA